MASETLKRLGGGRWESKDGRFAIEPQSGTWAVVDTTQTNELGLPLVLGPFPTLTAAKDAIAEARESGPAASPLAGRIERSKQAEKAQPRKKEPPPEPAWLRRLDEADRRRFRALAKRLAAAGVEDAEDVARAEIADDQPAVARLGLERQLARAASAKTPAAAVRRAVEAILDGGEQELGGRWRLVDGDGRPIMKVDLPD